jgi:sugar phosphate isomerase/epimerase
MKRSFRIGSTSFVYPDDILPNVRKLVGVVDDVELVLFEVDEYGTNLPDAAATAELNALAHANDLTFTVHLPLDLRFGDAVSTQKARRAIDATRPLNPFAYVMHLDGRALVGQPSGETISGWQSEAAHALAQVAEWVGDPSRVCVENVEAWDPTHFRDLVASAHASRCVDVGHFWLQRSDPIPHLVENLPITRVIHLHGVGSRDHQSLRRVPPDELQTVVDVLVRENYRGVLTLEVFGVEDFFASFDAVQEALGRSERK